MRIDERAPPDAHGGRRVTFKTILTTGPSRRGAGFKALLIIDVDECSPLDSVANRHETIPLKRGRFSAGMAVVSTQATKTQAVKTTAACLKLYQRESNFRKSVEVEMNSTRPQ